MIEKTYTDKDGDVARFEFGGSEEPGYVHAPREGAYLTDDDLRDLRAAIDEHLGDRPKVEFRDPAPRTEASFGDLMHRLIALPEPDPVPALAEVQAVTALSSSIRHSLDLIDLLLAPRKVIL